MMKKWDTDAVVEYFFERNEADKNYHQISVVKNYFIQNIKNIRFFDKNRIIIKQDGNV